MDHGPAFKSLQKLTNILSIIFTLPKFTLLIYKYYTRLTIETAATFFYRF